MSSPNDTPILDLLASMTADSIAVSSLDPDELMLVRIAALAAVDAPSVSYLTNLEAIADVGIDAERVRGVLAAIAPIVGTARVASATGKIVDALDAADTTALPASRKPGLSDTRGDRRRRRLDDRRVQPGATRGYPGGQLDPDRS